MRLAAEGARGGGIAGLARAAVPVPAKDLERTRRVPSDEPAHLDSGVGVSVVFGARERNRNQVARRGADREAQALPWHAPAVREWGPLWNVSELAGFPDPRRSLTAPERGMPTPCVVALPLAPVRANGAPSRGPGAFRAAEFAVWL